MHHLKRSNFNAKGIVHSIPILCIFTLLAFNLVLINPQSHYKAPEVYAADCELGVDCEDTGSGISLSIDGNSSNDSYSKSLNAVTNQTNYIAYNVVATASNIESYSLSIKYTDGSTSLKNSTAGATTINPVASTGVQGKSMTSNTWGWGWSDNTSTANGDMTYRPMQTSDSVIKSATASSANVNGKIVFAANFGEGATAGSYSTNALLSFAIQPKAVTTAIWSNGVDSGINNLQEMTSSVCNNSSVPINSTITLTDSRDSKSYSVAKLKDNKCWITQNLGLELNTSKTLTPNDTNITSNWTPANSTLVSTINTSVNGFADTNQYTVVSVTDHSHTDYGVYYSWLAATAGAGTSAVTSGSVSTSVCPKGWRMPTPTEFNTAINGVSGSALGNTPYNFLNSGRAGSCDDGDYWYSGTPSFWTNTLSNAYNINAISFVIQRADEGRCSYGNRQFGYSIRCIAQ